MSGEVAGGDGPVRVHMLKSDVEMEEQRRHAEQAEHEGLVRDPHHHAHHGEAGHSHQPVATTRHHERCANIKQDTLYAIALAVCVFLVVVLGAAILGALAHQQGWFEDPKNATTTNTTIVNNTAAAFFPVGNGSVPVNNSGAAAGADPNCGDCAGWAQRMMGGLGGLATVCGSALQPNGRATPACCGNLTQIFDGQQCTQFLISQLPMEQQNLVPGIAAQCDMELAPACPGTIVAAGTPIPTSQITTAAPSDSTTTAAPGSTTTTASPAGTATNVPAGDSTATTATPGGTATNVPSGSDTPQPEDTTSAAGTTTTARPQ